MAPLSWAAMGARASPSSAATWAQKAARIGSLGPPAGLAQRVQLGCGGKSKVFLKEKVTRTAEAALGGLMEKNQL